MNDPTALGGQERDGVTSKVQSSKVASLARVKNEGEDTRVTTRPRRPTPRPWTPSASSSFSRPTPPPLTEVSLDTVIKAVPTRETASLRTVAPASTAASKPAPATLPPPPVGMRKTKPAPDTLPPPPGITASIYVRPVPVMPMPGPAMPATRSIQPAMVVPVALGGASHPAVVMMTAVGASRPVVAAKVEACVEAVEAVEAPMTAPVMPSMVETSPIRVDTPELPGRIVVSEEELEELFADEPMVVEAAAVRLVSEPEPEPTFAPVAVERCDSVPLVVLASSMAPPRRASVIVAPRPSVAPTLEARVLQAMASSHAPARPSRRGIGLVLGAAASLLLAIGVAASAGSSPETREDLSLAANLDEPVALVKAWMARTQPSEPAAVPMVEPAAEAAPLPFDGELLAVANPTEAIEPAIEPAPQPRRSRRARSRNHAPAAAAQDAAPESAPAPRRSSTRKPRPVSAEELLFDGEVALRLGDAKQAFRLAKRSRDTGAHTDAASLVARSACRIGETDEAKQALRELPLLERGAVRRDCRRSGSRIGL